MGCSRHSRDLPVDGSRDTAYWYSKGMTGSFEVGEAVGILRDMNKDKRMNLEIEECFVILDARKSGCVADLEVRH